MIYSLTISSTVDAPQGIKFLYTLNRLNVAASRTKSNVINLRLLQRTFSTTCQR
jgi:superfamily I DNA and/or RNA helicase